MKNKNGKLEMVSCKYDGKRITIQVKKDNKIYEAIQKNILVAVVEAVKKATDIEGIIEFFEANSIGENAEARVRARFNKEEFIGKAQSHKVSNPMYLTPKACINAFNQYYEKLHK